MTVILKEGFLLKRDDSFMFPGWKKKFCQLCSDGKFTIGDGKHVEHKFNTKFDMKSIEQGFEAESLNLPKGRSDMESMFVVHAKHKKHFFLANNTGECWAWIGSIKNSQSQTSAAVAPSRAPLMNAPNHHGPPQSFGAGASHYPGQPPHHQPAYNPNYGH